MSAIESLVAQIERGPAGPRVGAFFDFDGTLIAGYSASVFWRERLRRGEASLGEVARSVLAGLEMGLAGADVTKLLEVAATAWAGRPEAELEELAERLWGKQIAGMVYPETRELVHAHQRMGHKVAIATSATRYQVAPLAADLGVEHLLHSRVEVVDGVVTGRLDGPVLWGRNKADAVRQFARRHRVDLRRSHAYGNGGEDVAYLTAVGHPHAINPGRDLALVARERGWDLHRFESRGSPGLVPVIRTSAAIGALAVGGLAGLAVGLINRSRRDAANVATAVGAELALGLAGVRIRVSGEENLWTHRPAVVIFNHQSSLDVLILGHLFRQDITGVAKQELSRDPIFAPVGWLTQMAYIDRSDSARARQELGTVVDRLREGISIAIAPEGTRSPSHRLGRFKKGAFHIAMEAGVPIVPIVIRNAGDLLWRGSFVARPGAVDVAVLPPISTRGWRRRDIDRRAAEIEALYRRTLESWPGHELGARRRHAAERRRRRPAARPAAANGHDEVLALSSTERSA
jgi:putative phosphoserine phosphatase/1-acylglycerol-3-phosphate O-acyltransferase